MASGSEKLAALAESVDGARWHDAQTSAHRLFIMLPVSMEMPDASRRTAHRSERSPLQMALDDFASFATKDTVGRFAEAPWQVSGPRSIRRKIDEDDDAWNARVAERSAAALWQVDTVGPSADFHPHVRGLFGYPAPGSKSWPGTPTLRLCREGVDLLQGAFGGNGHGLSLELGAAASQRAGLGAGKAELIVRVRGAQFQFFSSGVGLLVLELECGLPMFAQAPTLAMMLEMTHLLSRNPLRRGDVLLRWFSKPDHLAPTVIDLAESLLPSAVLKRDYEAQARFFIYSFVQTDVALSDSTLSGIATRVACRFTEDYDLAPDQSATLVTPFHGIAHAMSSEGGCVALAADRGLPFLKNFRNDPLPRVYLPLAELAYQEHLYLLKMSQTAQSIDIHRSLSDEDADKLEQLWATLARFRREFRFLMPSIVSLHDRTYAAWREALKLDDLLKNVADDVQEADRLQRQESTRRRERRVLLIESIGLMFGVAFFVWQATDAYVSHTYGDLGTMAGMHARETNDPAQLKQIRERLEAAYDEKAQREKIFAVCAALAGVGTGWFSLKYKARRG